MPDVQELLDRFHVARRRRPGPDLPRRAGPSQPDATSESPSASASTRRSTSTQIRDVVVVGAGPAGLAAAVYAASEGLDVAGRRGERARRPGRLELADRELPRLSRPASPDRSWPARAYTQAQKFGARGADRQRRDAARVRRASRTRSRSTAARACRRARSSSPPARSTAGSPLDNLAQFEGAGVYYGATFMEAQLCGGEEVIVVGGGNSAGQAAVFLAQTRADACTCSSGRTGWPRRMSRYLIRRIEENPQIDAAHAHRDRGARRRRPSRARARGDDAQTGAIETHAIRHVFLMTGAVPNTGWLDGCLALDDAGFIKTGPDLIAGRSGRGPLAARPRRRYLLETSLPGVFAVGDVRSRQRQARRVRGRRGIDLDLRSSTGCCRSSNHVERT